MALLERVATLVRANLNDLLDRAENPEKMLKQVILDMENQFMQVKTQVAIALADLHLLQKKKNENLAKHSEWMNKAELAVDKSDDELARAALDRAISFQQLAENFDQQIADQESQVESLKSALKRLDVKLAEARAKSELLVVKHRRARSANRLTDAEHAPSSANQLFDRINFKVAREETLAQAKAELFGNDIHARLHALERGQTIDRLLQEIKAKKSLGSPR
jgi:phage shock protein A